MPTPHKRPLVDFADPASLPHGGRPLEHVNLPPYEAVTRTLRVIPATAEIVFAYDAEKLQALQEANRVEFVAHLVGASDIRKELALWQDRTT
jgi:hypothetical protein